MRLKLVVSVLCSVLWAPVARAADAPPPPAPAPVPVPVPPVVEPRTVEEVVVRADRYVVPFDADVTTPTRTRLPDFVVPRATSTVSAEDIFQQASRTTPQALDQEPGVFVQQTNLGGGSAIVRGLTGEQVLLLMDGIRLNNATTRSGPTQYLTLVDPYMLDRIEVLRGPGSVMYGSDALGGVINLIPRRREDLTCCLDLNALLAGNVGTATDGGTVAGRYEGSYRGFGFTGGVNGHHFDDLRVGDDGGRQDDTGYEGLASDLRLEYAPAVGQRLALAYQFYEDRDVPRTDAIESGTNLAFEFDPQRRQLLYLDWRGERPGAFLEAWRVNVNVQRWDEGRYEVRSASPTRERRLYDRVDTWGVFGYATLRPHCDHRVTAGFELYHDDVYSRRRDTNTTTGVVTAGQARYPTGSTWMPLGIYVQDEWTPSPCWLIVPGLRYSRYDLHTAARPTTNPPVAEDDDVNDELTGSLAASYEFSPGWRAYGSVAQGFRAPNVDDTTVFDRAATGIEIPNADLEPEHVISYELGLKVDRCAWRAGLALWYSDFTDLIQRVQTNLIIDALPVSTRENVADAEMYGGEVWADVDLGRGWRAFGSASYARGTNLENDQPLNKVPPLNGIFGARWTRCDDRLWIEPFSRWSGRQTRLSDADKADFRIGPDGTPGWMTVNVRAGYQVDRHLELVVEAGNLLDERYKHHGSGVEDAGRYLTVAFEVQF